MILFPNQHPQFPDDWLLVKQTDHDESPLRPHRCRLDFRGILATVEPKSLQHRAGAARRRLPTRRGSASPDAGRRPFDFIHLPLDVHIERADRESVRAACAVSAYAGLLVSMHTVGIHRDRLHIDADPLPTT